MEFKTLFPILKKHLSDGYGVPDFMRDLIAMITEVPEDEWTTSKDPSEERRDSTLRSYAKRGLPQKMAQAIVYRLNPDNMVASIESRDGTQLQLLADDLIGYDPEINSCNVAEKVTDWMVEIIQRSAGLVQQDELSRQKEEKLAADLKAKYGDYLLRESNGYCPNCGRELQPSESGKVVKVFEVSLIDKTGGVDLNNLIAMCPQCHATYLLDDNKKLCKELKAKKKTLMAHKQSVRLLDDLPLESGITEVVVRIKKLKEKDLVDATLEPQELHKKLDRTKDLTLYLTVNSYVTTYYVRIREIMVNLDKSKVIDYDEVQDQMKALYRRLKKANKSKIEVFTEMSDKIHRVTLQEELFCQIVVSYFIEKCEVF